MAAKVVAARTDATPARRLLRLLPWLVPLAALLVLLTTSYASLTEQRYPYANGAAGEILAGGSVGQSFVSRYPNLTGVELWIGTYGRGGDPGHASLVLHLRAAPPDQVGQADGAPDLATVRLPAGHPLEENSWHLFSFPPIADSQDRRFYVEVESPDGELSKALTLFWWQPPGVGDPYPHGSAYRDGRERNGDLAFALRYSPSPLGAWAQVARAASVNLPPALMVTMALLALLGTAGAVRLVPQLMRDPERRNRWVRRYSLPLVLLVALVNGPLYLFLVPPWQGPDEHAHYAYAALLDRYDLDEGRVKALQKSGPASDRELVIAVDASMNRHDFTRRVLGYTAPGAPVHTEGSLFTQLRQPPAYYQLSALAMRTARIVGIGADPYAQPDTALRVMRAVSVLLAMGVAALAWLAGTLLSRGPSTGLRLLLPLTVALLPMHAFATSVANNDALAELAVSALFVALIALLRWPLGARGVALAALCVVLAAAGSAAKSTAEAASVPLLAFGLLAWTGILATELVRTRTPVSGWLRAWWVVPSAVVLLAVAFSVGALLFGFEARDDLAAGWRLNDSATERPLRVRTASAHDGTHLIALGASGKQEGIWQELLPYRVHHPRLEVSLSGWARPAEGADGTPGGAPPSTPTVRIELYPRAERANPPAIVTLDPLGGWTSVSATARIPEGVEQVSLWVLVTGGGVELDDFSLRVAAPDGPWRHPLFPAELLNPSAEGGSTSLRPLVAMILPHEVEQIADVLANPQPFDKGALWRHYADGQYRSFWGNFGWVSIPLPDALYALLGLLGLAALVGLARRGLLRVARWSYAEWVGLISLAALLIATAAGFARQAMLLALEDVAAYPQGRYLFVLILPFSWLLLGGLHSSWRLAAGWAQRVTALASRGRATARPEGTVNWGAWLYLNALGLFAAYAILTLIVPFFYG